MSAERYRKKPVVIEAIQVPPAEDLPAWGELAGWLTIDMADIELTGPADGVGGLLIRTLEGTMRADIGDWVIKGVAGEFYPCRPDIFAATYEPADSDPHTETLWEGPAGQLAASLLATKPSARGWDPDERVRVVGADTPRHKATQ